MPADSLDMLNAAPEGVPTARRALVLGGVLVAVALSIAAAWSGNAAPRVGSSPATSLHGPHGESESTPSSASTSSGQVTDSWFVDNDPVGDGTPSPPSFDSEEQLGTAAPPMLVSTPPSTLAPAPATAPEPGPATAPPQDDADPAVVARPIPNDPPPPPPNAIKPPWAASTHSTPAGFVSTDIGCARSTDAAGLGEFFGRRVGPVLGWDYQHVTDLGGGRFLWLFQDTFIDHSGTASTMDQASFAHNVALLQDGTCFALLHQGSSARPEPFEQGTGTTTLRTWFWPMGSEVDGDRVHVVWVKMAKDRVDPRPPDGLGWHPAETWIATYDAATLARLDFRLAPNPGVAPIYGYAMASDATHTYLFGNSFEQNLSREGGYWNGPHSATEIHLARVPKGQLFSAPEYRTVDGWSSDPADATPILARHWAEFPFQPRLIDGQWVGVAAVDGYWDERFSVDVANDPWGPWTTVESRTIAPRGGDPKMNTYHAQLMPGRGGSGELIVSISNNARDMARDAWTHPERYRPDFFSSNWVPAPPRPPPPAEPTTTPVPATTSTTTVPATTTTTVPATTTSTTTTTTAPTTSTTVPPTTSTTSTTSVPPTTSTSATTVPATTP